MIRVAVLTVSDRSARGERADLSGPAIAEIVAAMGGRVDLTGVVPDEREAIAAWLIDVAEHDRADLALTTGGTGFAPRDVTPEATADVIERAVPGLAEAMRAGTLARTPFAMISRAMAGIRRRTLIVNLPGNPKAVRECLDVIAPVLPHAIAILRGDAGDHG